MKKREKGGKYPWGFLAGFCILFFLSVFGVIPLGLLVGLGFAVGIIGILVKTYGKNSSTGESTQQGQLSVPVHREFPEPEAHCVVCENTGENHFERDRKQRLAQLDEWLKNGLIDKAEYRELKKRYEKNG